MFHAQQIRPGLAIVPCVLFLPSICRLFQYCAVELSCFVGVPTFALGNLHFVFSQFVKNIVHD